LSLANASRRVINFLIQERDLASDDVVLQVPKRLVASKLGIQPETFSRILHRLVDAGLIEVQRRTIRIMCEEQLMTYQAG
ncbi:helix-turn-helix domain-containing protein, partial [Salmonella enterica subsp. enterica]